jgi:hypothetical protein
VEGWPVFDEASVGSSSAAEWCWKSSELYRTEDVR